MLLAIFGKVIKHSSFGYLLHDICHLVNRPLLRSEVETATIEPSISFIVQVNRIQLTKHSHGCYSVQNRGTLLEIASVAETHEGENAFSHERGTKTDQILAKTLNSIPSRLSWQPLGDAKFVCSLILHFGDQYRIGQFITRLPANIKDSPVWTNRAAVKVIMEFDFWIGSLKLCHNIFQIPLAFMHENYSFAELFTEVVNNLLQGLYDV